MSSTGNPTVIYPWFSGDEVQIDLYVKETDQEPVGGASFPLDHLVDEYIAEFGDDDGVITEHEAIEDAYVLIDALRESANKLAAAVKEDE